MHSAPQPLSATSSPGSFIRQSGTFSSKITRDGSSGFLAEPARYQLYASLACPWSQRALIVRRLLGLDRVVGLSLVDPISDDRGWRFPDRLGGRDPVTGARFVSELYLASDPRYSGEYTLPVLWDTKTQRIVSNDVSRLTVMLETEFTGFCRPGAPDLYPPQQAQEIEAISTLIHHAVNNGVYKAGNAATQAAYEEAFDALFDMMDALDERLGLAQVPARRRADRGRCAAVPYAGQVRRGLLHPLQVQPAPAGRLPLPVGLRA